MAFFHQKFSIPQFNGMSEAFITLILVSTFILIEWFGRNGLFAIECIGMKWKREFRWLFYFTIISTIFIFNGEEQQFIYFQF